MGSRLAGALIIGPCVIAMAQATSTTYLTIPVRRTPLRPCADPGLCPDWKKLALIRQDVALLPCTGSRGPGHLVALYTHNPFTIVNYLELLDKQRAPALIPGFC